MAVLMATTLSASAQQLLPYQNANLSAMAGALISALPLLIVFFFVQKRFVEGIAMTGMK